MNLDTAQSRYVTNVKKKLADSGRCAVFSIGGKLHYTKSVDRVPELLAVYDASCPDEYIQQDAVAFVK